MEITVNGESRRVEPGTTLQELLTQMDVNCDALVVDRKSVV